MRVFCKKPPKIGETVVWFDYGQSSQDDFKPTMETRKLLLGVAMDVEGPEKYVKIMVTEGSPNIDNAYVPGSVVYLFWDVSLRTIKEVEDANDAT